MKMKIKSYILLVALFLSYNLYGQTKQAAFNKSKDAVVKILASELPEIGFRSNSGSGTGYIASQDGYIITNHHVIDGAVVINVILTKGDINDTIPAYTLWSDQDMDMAVLKVDKTNLPFLEFEKKNKINHGDEVLAIGYPGGSKDVKVTWGIISGIPNDSTLNTTAALNSGNSGGPCVNLDGKVVGTIFAKQVSVAIEGSGFLRSIDYASRALEEAKNINDSLKELIGTDNKEAYKELCKAEAAFININYYEDDDNRAEMLDKALNHINKALGFDSNYTLAYFFKASYELFYAFYQCELNQEDESYKYTEKFYGSLTRARETDLNTGKYDNYNEKIDNQLDLFLDGYEVDCDEWNEVLDAMQKNYAKKDQRMRDFDNYIKRGERPEMLADMLGAVERSSRKERDWNFGITIAGQWNQSIKHDGPGRIVITPETYYQEGVVISGDERAYLKEEVVTYNFMVNYKGFGLGLLLDIKDNGREDNYFTLLTLRYKFLEFTYNFAELNGTFAALAPKFGFKYVSPGYYSPMGTGFKSELDTII